MYKCNTNAVYFYYGTFSFDFFLREIKCTCHKKTSMLKKPITSHTYIIQQVFFCKVDKFLPHIFLGAYKMATKMTLTYVKMTCFFHENIFFSYLLKIKLSKHTLDYVLDASTLVLSNYVSVRTESCGLKLIFR